MRFVLLVTLAALAVPAAGQGFGGASQQSTTTSQTTTTKTQSGDTTTTTTTTTSETTSSGGGLSFGNLFGKDHDGHGPAAPSYESVGGKWKISETGGTKTCDLTLDKTKFISNYGAHTSIGCPEGLFGVSSWMLAGDEIRLMSPGGSLLAKLHAGRAGRWDGRTEQGLEVFMVRD
jgi:hypothetical protein